MQDFDFETWSQLHETDPAEFERRREALLNDFIETANPDSRRLLEQTMFTLQMHRQKSKSPLQSAIFASNLMWESFGKLRETMDEARSVFEESRPTLTLVGGKQMSAIDRIVNGWAAGVPVAADSESEAIESAQTRDAGTHSNDPASRDMNKAPSVNGQSGARIFTFPARRVCSRSMWQSFDVAVV